LCTLYDYGYILYMHKQIILYYSYNYKLPANTEKEKQLTITVLFNNSDTFVLSHPMFVFPFFEFYTVKIYYVLWSSQNYLLLCNLFYFINYTLPHIFHNTCRYPSKIILTAYNRHTSIPETDPALTSMDTRFAHQCRKPCC
jgi:hypothetical protein